MYGYRFTISGDMLRAIEVPGVRFAGSLSDGTGLIAFDGPEPTELQDIPGHTVMIVPVPDGHDPSLPLPDWYKKAAPKRGVSNGLEHFSIVDRTFERYLHEQASVTGVVALDEARLLVESQGRIAIGVEWTASIVDFADVRLVLA